MKGIVWWNAALTGGETMRRDTALNQATSQMFVSVLPWHKTSRWQRLYAKFKFEEHEVAVRRKTPLKCLISLLTMLGRTLMCPEYASLPAS